MNKTPVKVVKALGQSSWAKKSADKLPRKMKNYNLLKFNSGASFGAIKEPNLTYIYI